MSVLKQFIQLSGDKFGSCQSSHSSNVSTRVPASEGFLLTDRRRGRTRISLCTWGIPPRFSRCLSVSPCETAGEEVSGGLEGAPAWLPAPPSLGPGPAEGVAAPASLPAFLYQEAMCFEPSFSL